MKTSCFFFIILLKSPKIQRINIVIEIKAISDSHDCETCGGSWEEGFEVTIDGKPFGDYKAYAHCFDSVRFELSTVLEDIIKHLGHDIVVIEETHETNEDNL